MPLKQFQCLSERWWPSLVLSLRIVERFLSSRLSAPGDRYSVMSLALCAQVMSQASQHFRSSEMQAICDGCFYCRLFGHFPSLQHVQGSTTGLLEGVCRPLTHSSLGFLFHFHFLQLIGSVRERDGERDRVCVCVSACVCVCACVRTCVCVCVRARARV